MERRAEFDRYMMEEDIWVLEEAIRVSVERQVMEESMRAKREK